MHELGQWDRRRLLEIARGAIESVLCRDGMFEVDLRTLSAGLCQTAAAFVTLREEGEIRGCVGRMRFDLPVWTNVRSAAVDAAFEDPRFVPLSEAELPRIELEISVLEPPVPIADASGFEPGRHGVIVERGLRMALLLPQVATEMGWGAPQMLGAVCRKAGLPENAWREPSTKLRVFEATHFSETATVEMRVPAGAVRT
jgi:AmmeMemoRadiSam system protein A